MPEPEGGEDVDLTPAGRLAHRPKLVGVLVLTIATVNLLGWAITGAVLFAGCRLVPRQPHAGPRRAGRRSSSPSASWYAFYVGLGIPLTPGMLDGVL